MRTSILLAILLAWACSGDEPEIETWGDRPLAQVSPLAEEEQPPTSTQDREPAEDRADSITLKIRVLELEDIVRRRDEEIASLKAQLAAALDETSRYEQGLKRAVGELNSRRAPPPPPRRPAPPPPRSKTGAYIHPPEYFIPGPGSMRVFTTLYNLGKETISGAALIKVDGRRVHSVDMSISPNSGVTLSETLDDVYVRPNENPVVEVTWESR